MKKVYLLPNLMTAFGLACGLFVIFKVSLAPPAADHFELMKTTALLLFLAALSDTLDGLIARRLQAETDFGFQFDSLADAITFGVAPSVVILKTLQIDFHTQIGTGLLFASMVFSISAVLRLVRFNVHEKEKEELREVTDKHFIGLPVPSAALTVIATNWNFTSGLFSGFFFSQASQSILTSLVLCVVGYLMVCRLRFPSLKTLNFKVPRFHLAFTSVIVALMILYGAFYHFPLLLFTLNWVYILSAILMAFARKIRRRGSQALEEFEEG